MKNLSPLLFRPPSEHDPDGEASRPVVASYIVTFLKPEMLHIYRQITALSRFQPIVFAQKVENERSFPFSKICVLPKPRSHQLRRFWQKQILGRPITIYRSEARHILEALHKVRAQVLHVYFGHIGVHLLPLLEICDVPVVVSFHGADAQVHLDKPAHRARTVEMINLATLILVRSESLAQRIVALGCPRNKIRLHRTGIPVESVPFRPRTTPPDGVWRCLQACRLIEKKGIKTSLQAFAQFHKTYPDATLTIAGEGPQLVVLQSLVKELGLQGKVHFPGFLSQENLKARIAESHLFLHPSELGPDGDQEGVPNAMLEAMASGLPAMATVHGGIVEAVEHGVSGYLVPEGDHDALAMAMLELAADPARYAQTSINAASRVSAEFDLRVQALALETIYSQAIDLYCSKLAANAVQTKT